jgi:hypothetical protein
MRQECPRYQKARIKVSQVLMTFNCHRKKPKQDPPGRLSSDFRIHKFKKLLVVGREERSTLPDSVRCVLHISEVKLETFVNSALFCFTQGLVLRNTIH